VEGNSHGLTHFEATQHPVSVKLGTITPEGDADVYCYACDDAKQDPEVAAHLAEFGIHIRSLRKTEKSMTELQIEQNMTYEFSLTSQSGEALQPLCGPGLTGLANLGNSCYISSILQTIFSLSAFQDRYFSPLVSSSSSPSSSQIDNHAQECNYSLPAECIECQMRKIADGLLSGRYAVPAPGPAPLKTASGIPTEESPAFQAGIRPSTFKSLIGTNHAEFSTMRQQDAEEFFGHLLSFLRRDSKRRGISLGSDQDATRVFEFGVEQKLRCSTCSRVRYRVDVMDRVGVAVPAVPVEPAPGSREEGEEEGSKDARTKKKKEYEPVSLKLCIDSVLLSDEGLEYTCPGGCGNVIALRHTRFSSFPDILVIHAKKFELVNWVPTKLDIPVIVPENDTLVFDEKYIGKGLQPGEVELPDHHSGGGSRAPPEPVDEEVLMQLEGMGFPRVRCEKALRATGNTGLETAMEWVLSHMDDPDIDVPETAGPLPVGAGGKPEPPQEMVSTLTEMGFTPNQAKKALRETDLNMERAVEWLFSHPDDSGEDDGVSPLSAARPPPPTNAKQEIRGSTDAPARFVLKAFVSHKGPSVHSGHYVAHVKVVPPTPEDKEGEWVLFNDEKVVRADEESVNELKKLAYLYVFERVEA
jgi:ubiquitin carboxyl-terminal hydrolase 5/13